MVGRRLTGRSPWFRTLSVVLCAGIAASCAPAPTVEPSASQLPSSRDTAVLCADLGRLADIAAVLPAIQEAAQADDQARTYGLAQALRSELELLIEDFADPERIDGFDAQVDAVIGSLEHGAEHLDDYLTGRSPGNLGPGLDELESAESDYRSIVRERYPGVDCSATGVETP